MEGLDQLSRSAKNLERKIVWKFFINFQKGIPVTLVNIIFPEKFARMIHTFHNYWMPLYVYRVEGKKKSNEKTRIVSAPDNVLCGVAFKKQRIDD